MKRTFTLLICFMVACVMLRAQVVVSGDITTNTTWTKNNTYLLQGFVYVTNGAKLTIEAGTVIKGEKASKGSLIITRGTQLIADGTASEPIVFTSNESTPNYGDWGGLIILGYAPTNQSYNGTACLGLIEGGLDVTKGLYGSGDQPGGCGQANDNSGVLRYVRIEYAGIAFQPNNEINGITFGGVGNGTVVDHVQVSYANDDSFEWFGGTVNCKHLIAYRGLDDDFDCDFGYAGNVQYAMSVRDPLVADVSSSNGFEIDNNAQGTGATPKTRPTFSNVTMVGPTGTVDALYKRAAHLRRNSEPGIFNTLLLGNYPEGLLIDGDSCANNATANRLEVKNVIVAGPTTLVKATVTNGFDVNAWFATAGFSNQKDASNDFAKLQDAYNLDVPNAQPEGTSPARNAASFTAPRINNAFFDNVSYIGAFGGTTDWTCGWAKFQSLNVACLTETKDIAAFMSGVKVSPTVAQEQVTLEMNMVQSAELNVSVYDMSGRFFGQLLNERVAQGEQRFILNTADLKDGFYFLRIQAGTSVKTEKLMIIR